MPVTDYKPVPVTVALAIADNFEKDVVVIMAIDRAAEMTHFTSYGKSPDDKIEAAHFADLIAASLGAAEPKERFEDFRFYDQAKRARKIELAAETIRMLQARLAELDPRDVAFQFEGESYRPQARAAHVLHNEVTNV